MKNHIAFVDVVKAIARVLGWLFDATWDGENLTTARLVGPDGARIHIRVSTYDYRPDDGSRLEISGSYPHHPRYGSFSREYPSITVAASKEPQVIARDIQRRFLPKYLPLYQKARQAEQDYVDGLARQGAVIQQLADVMGSKTGQSCVYLPSTLSCYGRIEVYEGGDAVKIELGSVPVKLAIEIAMVLANFGEKGERKHE